MIPNCPNCTVYQSSNKLTYSNKILMCTKCGYIYPKEIIEQDALVLSKDSIERVISPEITLRLMIKDCDENLDIAKYELIEEQFLPIEMNGKKVKQYKLIANYEIKVYYENT